MPQRSLSADILWILAAVLVVLQLGARWHESRTLTDSSTIVKQRVVVDRPGLLVTGRQPALVVVTASYCHFCRESIPFYTSLFPLARRRGARVLAVTPEDPGSNESYLSSNGLDVEGVFSADSVGMIVRGTPTLLLLNADGTLIDSWVGILSERDQANVVREVTGLWR